MEETSRHRRWTKEQTPEQRLAREQMAWFPHTGGDSVVDGDGVEILFVREDIWVVSVFVFSAILDLLYIKSIDPILQQTKY